MLRAKRLSKWADLVYDQKLVHNFANTAKYQASPASQDIKRLSLRLLSFASSAVCVVQAAELNTIACGPGSGSGASAAQDLKNLVLLEVHSCCDSCVNTNTSHPCSEQNQQGLQG